MSVTKEILFVEDEQELQKIVSKYLSGQDYSVTCASDGVEAIEKFKKGKFDVVLSDYKMPGMDGLELLSQVRRVSMNVPFIFITAYIDLLDASKALKLGAYEIVTKPISPEKIHQMLELLFKGAKKEPEAETAYKEVSIDLVLKGNYSDFDRYIKIGNGRYIPVAFANDEIEEHRVAHYKNKGVKFLYVKQNDINHEFNQLKTFGNVLQKKSSTQSAELKAKFVGKYSSLVADQILKESIDQETVDQAQECLSTAIDLVSDEEEGLNLLELLSQQDDFLNAHSVGVSIVSSLVAQKMDIKTKANLINISLGGLLHDIGKTKLDEKLYSKPMFRLKKDEKIELQKHPLIGYEIIKFVPSIPEVVHKIVLQHHEDCLGLGYPIGLKGPKITKSAKIISVVNDFCKLTIKNPCFDQKSIKDALDHLQRTNPDKYDKEALRAIVEVFKLSSI